MEDMKSKLSEIEDQVSSIKDPALRKAAFEKLLENALRLPSSRASSRGSQLKAGSSKRKRKINSFYSESRIRDEVKRLNVTGVSKGLPPFKKCKSKIDSYLWIMAYAKQNKIEDLNNHEIAFIMTKKLYKPTKYSTVNGIRRKVREGLVILDPDTESWRITPDGETHLQTLDQQLQS